MKNKLVLFLTLLLASCSEQGEEKLKDNEQVQEKIEQEKDVEKEEGLKIKNISTNSGKNPSIDIAFNEELSEENLEAYVKLEPKVEYKISKLREHLIITGKFDVNKEYDLKILNGLKSEKGQLLKDIDEKIKFKEVEPKLSFSNDGIILPKLNENRIAFKSINVKRVNLKIKKIFLNNTTQFLQDFNFKGNGNIFDYNLQDNLYKVGETIVDKTYDLEYKKNSWIQTELDLNNQLKGEKGVFIIELSFDKDGVEYTFLNGVAEWQKENFFRTKARIGKALIVSDMGLVAQKDRTGKMVVTVLDVIKNSPIKNVNLKAISVNNQLLDEKKSDVNGEVSFENGDKIFYVVAEKGEELSLLKLNDSKLSYDGFLVEGEYSQDGVRAFIYSDRGVYRPGDRVNIGIIARNDKKTFPEGHPIKIDVFTPRGDKYIDGKVLTDGKNGFFSYSFDTKKESETGVWEVTVYVGGEKERSFSLKIPVESIVPYKIEVESKFPKEVKSSTLNGELSAKYLFGAPADNLKFTTTLTLRERKIEFEGYRNFTFSNPTTYIADMRVNQSGKLDENGKSEVEFNISKNTPKNISLAGEIVIRVIEPSGRAVIDISKVDVNNFDSYVGIEKPEDNFLKSGDKLNLQVVALSKDGSKLVNGRKVKYRVYKNEYSWWWDYYDYSEFLKSIKSDKNTILLHEGEFISSDKPYLLDYEVDGSGEIFVEVEDMETHQSAGTNLYVATWQDSSVSKQIDRLKIESDKKEYNVGDTAHIKFEGEKGTRALITVTKAGMVQERYWKEITGVENYVDVEVKPEYFPNAYVTVALFQSYQNSTNDRPMRLYGAVPIVVKDESKKLNLDIEAPLKLKPNEKFKIGVVGESEMEYTISVVDEGILQITDYKTPNPYSYFYQKEGLELSAYDNYSEIIGRTFGDIHQILTVGGDSYLMAKSRMDKMANSFGFEQSTRFEPLSIYRGVLTTDVNGKGEVELQLPNYTGAVKVMVVGAKEDKYGMAQKKIEVKAPIITDISMPRVLKVGDEIEVGVRLFATELDLGNIDVKFEFLGKSYSQKVQLKENESKDITFKVKVGNEIGNKEAKLKVKSSKYSNEEIINIDVTSNNPYTYINEVEYLKNGEKTIEFPKESVKGSELERVIISTQPILALDGRLKELLRYPYGCLEQSVSTAFPQLFIERLSEDKELSKEKSVKNINATIERLSSYQLSDGSFAYWPGNREGDLWGTNYVGHFLVIAKEKGYYIPKELYDSWLNFAKEKSRESDYPLQFKAYTLYVLALAGEEQISEMNYLYDTHLKELDDISKWYLATAYKLVGEDKIARDIADKLPREVKEKPFDYYLDSYGSKLRDEAVVLNSYYTIYGEIEEKLYSDILKNLQSQNWLSTQSIGYSLMALAQVVDKTEGEKLVAQVDMAGKSVDIDEKSGVWEYSGTDVKDFKIKGENIYIAKYWEGIPINYQEKNESKNIKLERKFYNEAGEEIDVKTLKKGETFYMELKVLPADDVKSYYYLDNLALTQIIPSGWEIENSRVLGVQPPEWIRQKSENNSLEYEDIRDDRVNFFFDFNNYNKQGQSFFIKLNAVTRGKYRVSGAQAEGMYNGEYRAKLSGFDVEVR